MQKKSPWKVIHSEIIAADRFQVKKEIVEVANGKEKNFSSIRFSDGVCVLAITENKQVAVLQQYRHAVAAWEYEFPAGMIDPGEKPIEAARRELLEETGMQAAEWIELGFFHPSPGSTSETIHLYAATGVRQVTAPALDDSEEIEMALFELEKVHDLIRNGAFRHGAGLAALLKYHLLQ